MTTGTLFLRSDGLLPARRAPRALLLFPLSGPLATGVVVAEARRLPGGRYAFRRLLVELPGEAAVLKGPHGVATAAAAAEAATAAARSPAAQPAVTSADSSSNSSSSSHRPDHHPSDQKGGSNAAADAASGVGAGAAVLQPARVCIVGGPPAPLPGSGSSSPPSARQLLESLSQPLVFALQRGLVGFEAEDELAAQLGGGWGDLQVGEEGLLEDQRTLWDAVGCAVGATWALAAAGAQRGVVGVRVLLAHAAQAVRRGATGEGATAAKPVGSSVTPSPVADSRDSGGGVLPCAHAAAGSTRSSGGGGDDGHGTGRGKAAAGHA